LEKEEFDKIVKEVVEFVKDVPDEYRHITYEVLLAHRLRCSILAPSEAEKKKDELPSIPLHVNVKGFMRTHNIPDEVLGRMFLVEGESTAWAFTITTEAKATAQIQVACLTALEHALHSGVFEFSIEGVRQRVRNLNRYDGTNFMTTFRQNSQLFESLDDPEHVELTSEGLAELARVMEEVMPWKKTN
jgi:hypothetical protein